MSPAIPKEEGVALTLLSVFGAIKSENLNHALFKICNEYNNYWYLKRMVRQMKIFEKDGYFLANPRSEPKEQRTLLYWVLMQYLERVNLATLQRERSPEGLSFVMDNKYYRIISSSPVPDVTTALVNEMGNEEVNCILIVPDEESIKDYREIRKRHCFAIVNYEQDKAIPNVTFYTTTAARRES